MEITGTLVISPDAVVLPVTGLSSDLRRQINAEEGDFAVTRPSSRTTTRIIDADAARLLDEFRQPSTVVQAVVRYCRANQKSPEETLDAAFPMLQRLVQERLLVPSDSPHAQRIRPLLDTGSIFAGAEVLTCIHNLEDTDVYRVRRSNGALAALKLMRSNADPAIATRFDREAAVLEHLDGAVSPLLLQSDPGAAHRYLLLSWCDGSDSATLAARFREAGNLDALLKLCLAILHAYARLHNLGVLHSDIHTGNVLVDDRFTVRLVDFGLARIVDAPGPNHPTQRGGVAYFMEPEYFAPQPHAQGPPPSSTLGEQYSLAAMLYFLLTGKHYLDFSFERHEMERQILEDALLPFTAHGLRAWPAVEAPLAKALSKLPTNRFPSIDAFAAQLALAEPTPPVIHQHLPSPSAVGHTLERVLTRLAHLPDSDTTAPASLTYGSAGVACALHRIASARRDPRLLALADLWSERAIRDFPLQDATYAPAADVTTDPVGPTSPYHMESGGQLVRAHIAHARGDAATRQRAVDDFVTHSLAPCEHLDLTLGRSGSLLAAADLLSTMRNIASLDTINLRNLGDTTLASIWTEVDGFSPIVECSQVRFSGMAHGWAGILYATLCWARASGAPPPSSTAERLHQLAEVAHHAGTQASWNPHINAAYDAANPFTVSWCNGTAGHVHLWLAAYSALKDEQYLLLAEQAGRHAADTGNGLASLCCGLTGQAYALLALYRQTREDWWLHRARQLAEKAAGAYQEFPATSAGLEFDEQRYSLFKGELGLAVLAADLEHPANSAFPAFEPIMI